MNETAQCTECGKLFLTHTAQFCICSAECLNDYMMRTSTVYVIKSDDFGMED